LNREAIPCRVVEVAGETRICQTLIDQSRQVVTELVEESPALTDDELSVFAENVEDVLPESGGLVVLSGSPPPGSGPGLYAQWVSRFQTLGHRVMIDAQKKPLAEALKLDPFLVKANREEWETTLGVVFESESACLTRLAGLVTSQAIECAVMTLGAGGVLFATTGGAGRITHPSLQALNPIGSGDSMMAGIACGLSHRLPLEQCLHLGVACGMANTVTELSGMIRLEDVREMLPKVKMEQ
jgi:tagatose 6-phosphate kinase